MINAWLEQLSERDKKIGLIGILILFTYLIYWFVFANISEKISNQEVQIAQKQETLIFMQNTLKQAPPTNQQPGKIISNLLSTLDQSISQSPLKAYNTSLKQNNQQAVNVSFQQVPFNSFIKWFYAFSHEYQINLTSLDITKNNTEPGMVSISVMIST